MLQISESVMAKIRVFRRKGTAYSTFVYDLDANLTTDGRLILAPEDAAFEIKFPSVDIVGTVL